VPCAQKKCFAFVNGDATSELAAGAPARSTATAAMIAGAAQ
jgi:hypothetical protein